jgi:hypothetical protein
MCIVRVQAFTGINMITLKKILLIGLLLISISANADNKSLTIYVGGCEDVDQSADVMYAADQNFNDLKKMKVTITVDETKKHCGYSLRNEKKIKNLNSGLTDMDLYEELFKFFGDKESVSK